MGMATLKYFAVYWLPVLVYCLMIFIQSSLPASVSISKITHFDKLLHFAAYSVLGALFYRAFFTTRFGKSELKTALISIFAASLYGLSDEIHQAFVPSRTPDIRDVLADSLGALAGVLAFWKWTSRGKKR